MWIEMFFIKFEGKIENVRGNEHFQFYPRNFFWENYQLLDIAFWNKYLFFRYEKIPNVSHIYIGLLLLHTVTIYFVVLPISIVLASWRNGIASDFDMSGTLPLPWVRVPATPLSFSKSKLLLSLSKS